MDQELIRFRQAADRENRGRRPIRRRYSPTLQQQAIDYWGKRRSQEGLRPIAAALGVAPWTLHRWTRASTARSGFRPVQVIAPEQAPDATSLVVTVTADGRPRVEGLSVEAAARLLTLLR
jgi:hypothetical protein